MSNSSIEPVSIEAVVDTVKQEPMIPMTNSKKDSELELDCFDLSHEQVTKILKWHKAIIDSKYITKEESDRRVLEARAEEADYLVKAFTTIHFDSDFISFVADRIAELRELLKGDKE